MFFNFVKNKDPIFVSKNNLNKILCPRVFKFNSKFYRIYFSNNYLNDYTNIKSATSKDCQNWNIDHGERIFKLKEKKYLRILSPSIIKIGYNLFRMYFEARTLNKKGVIKSAISNDGFNWTEEEGIRINNSNLFSCGTPFCLKEENKGVSLFFQKRFKKKKEICVAHSNDGLIFNNNNVLSLIKQESEYETYSVLSPDVVHLNNIYHMFYSGWSLNPNRGYILYAYSHDGVNWIKKNKPILSPGGTYDTKHCSEPSVIIIGNLCKIFYEACDKNNIWRILCAQQSL